MSATPDEATEQFLAVASDALQWEIRSAAVVESLTVSRGDDGAVMLNATVRVGGQTTTVRGIGDNLIEAYGDLRRHHPEAVLATAFRQVVGRP